MNTENENPTKRTDGPHLNEVLDDLRGAAEVSFAKIVRLAQQDARLAELIFHEANALRHRVRRPIRSIEHAVVFVGSRRIRELAETLWTETRSRRTESHDEMPDRAA